MAEQTGNERRQSEQDRQQAREAERIIARAGAESETLGGSALARAARHFAGADAPAGDAIELWGRRIGRVLALFFALYLVISLAGFLNR